MVWNITDNPSDCDSEYLCKECGGLNNVPVDISSYTQFEIYLPNDFIEDVYREISSATGELKSLNLQQVKAKVWVAGDPEPYNWSLQPTNGMFFRKRQ